MKLQHANKLYLNKKGVLGFVWVFEEVFCYVFCLFFKQLTKEQS